MHTDTSASRYDHFTQHPFESARSDYRQLDPTAPPPFVDFQWATIFQNLDGELPPEPRNTEAMGQAVREFLRWLTAGNDLPTIGARAVSTLLVLGGPEERERLQIFERSLTARRAWDKKRKARRQS